MLQNLREHITGWIASVIIALIAAAFVLWGIEYYLDANHGAQAPVAKVGDKKITQQQLSAAYQQLVNNEEQKGVTLNNAMRAQIKQYALQALIANTALLSAAKQSGFDVSVNQIKQLVMSAPEFQTNGQFSSQLFQRILMANSLTPDQFFNQVQSSLINNQVMAGFQLTTFVLPSQLKETYELMNQKRSFSYLLLPAKHFVSQVSVSDQDVKDYYQQNSDNFKIPEKVSAQYILLSAKSIADTVKVNDAEVKSYYQTNIGNYTIPQRWHVQQILIPLDASATPDQVAAAKKAIEAVSNSIVNGTSFESAMKNKPADAKASTVVLSADQLTGSMATVLPQLKAGQISNVFRNDEGFVMLNVVSIDPAKPRPFDTVKAGIENMLKQQQAQQILSEKGDKFSNLTYTNPSTLEPAAQALNLKIQTTGSVTRDGDKSDPILSDSQVLAALFSDSVLTQGNNSNPISLKNGDLVVVRVDQHVPAKEKPLSEVAAQVKAALLNQMAQRKAGLVAYQIQTALQQSQNPMAVAKKYGLNWVEVSDMDRNNKTMTPEILNAAFTLPAHPVSGAKNASTTATLKNGDYAVVMLNSVQTPSFAKATAKEIKTLSNAVANFSGQVAYKFYQKGVMDHAQIKINQSVLEGE